MSFSVAAGRYLHPRIVPRPRLIQRFDGWATRRCTAIIAPAGYGKSTGCSLWMREISPDTGTTWLTLDATDRTAAHLVQRLAAALGASDERFSDIQTAARLGQVAPSILLQSLLLRMKGTRPHILILDDAYCIEATDVQSLVQRLLDEAPPNLHVVLITRAATTLQYPDETRFVTVDDLRFDHEEFIAYASSSRLGDLSAARIAHIEQITDGWISAMQLLSLTPEFRAEDIFPQGRSGQMLMEYLDRTALRSLPQLQQDFLLRVSILPWFDAELAMETCGWPRAQALSTLEVLLATYMFVQPHHEPSLYRLHPLIHDFLKKECAGRLSAQEICAVRQRAATALARRGWVDEAIALLITENAAGDAAAFVAEHTRAALLRNDFSAVRRWTAAIDTPTLHELPESAEIMLVGAWVEFLLETPDRLARFESVRAVFETRDMQPAHIEEMYVLGALNYWAAGRYADAHAMLRRAGESTPRTAAFVNGFRTLAAVVIPGYIDDAERRQELLRQADEAFAGIDFAYGRTIILAAEAMNAMRVVDVSVMLRKLDTVTRLLDTHHLNYSVEALTTRAAYAEALYWVDLLPESATNFHRIAASSMPHVDAAQPKGMAEICLELITLANEGQEGLFFDSEQDAISWSRTRSALSAPPAGRIAFLRVLRDALRSDRMGAARTLQIGGFDIDNLEKQHPHIQLAVHADAVLFGGSTPAHEAALQKLRAQLESTGNALLATRCSMLLVASAELTERPVSAAQMLAELLPTIERTRIHRMVLDMRPLHLTLSRIDTPYARRLTISARRPDLRTVRLTKRQIELLRMLATAHDVPAISRELHLTQASVYVRCSELYRRLNVRNRDEAVHAFEVMHWLK